jgi:pimeloyl-ACP methyl ester carboxylesterase
MKSLLLAVLPFAALFLATQFGVARAERSHPPQGDFTLVNGQHVHFVDRGEGPAVVLVHGASTSLQDFSASILDRLAEHHRVIAVDRPGHGYSERPAGPWPDPAKQARLLHGLLEQRGVERPVLVGHSWSGSVVLAYLLAYPDAAAGGVLLAGGSHPWEGGVAWYNDVAGVPVLRELFAWTLVYPLGVVQLEAAVRRVFEPDPVPPDYVRRTGVRLSLRPRTFLANADDVRLLSDFLERQSRHYDRLEPPLLLVTGDADDIVPAWNHADRLAKQAPDARLEVLEGTGHALHHAQPERIAGLISGFTVGRAQPGDALASAETRGGPP